MERRDKFKEVQEDLLKQHFLNLFLKYINIKKF